MRSTLRLQTHSGRLCKRTCEELHHSCNSSSANMKGLQLIVRRWRLPPLLLQRIAQRWQNESGECWQLAQR
jgi:hypothetical protein